jgi:hypothetical protein
MPQIIDVTVAHPPQIDTENKIVNSPSSRSICSTSSTSRRKLLYLKASSIIKTNLDETSAER